MNDAIKEVLTRAVSALIDPDGSFAKKLQLKAEGKYDKDLIIKLGIDPTRPDIHLGFAVVLRKLRQFQDLGCKVVFIVGDFTAQIGDPTGKSKIRPEIEQRVVEENAKTYIEQVSKILKTDADHFSWIRNSDWFTAITDLGFPKGQRVKITGDSGELDVDANSFGGKAILFENTRMQKNMGLQDISVITLRSLLWQLKHITHSQLIERDMFQERIKAGSELYMHEMLYPVLQGIDSSVISRIYGSCDLEIGGTDQHFNMLMGRTVMKDNGNEPQAVMTMEILPGTDGKEKMSKSMDNYIAITESPEEMFGKVMSVPDNVIGSYFRLATYTPLESVDKIEKEIAGGKGNPRDLKARLAREIVEIYHGPDMANAAEENFNNVFKEGAFPENAPEVSTSGSEKLSDILVAANIVESKSDFRRLVAAGAIEDVSGIKITDVDFVPTENMDLKIGKKRFAKIRVR